MPKLDTDKAISGGRVFFHLDGALSLFADHLPRVFDENAIDLPSLASARSSVLAQSVAKACSPL